MKLAARLRDVTVSATLAMKAEADRLKAAGLSVVDLGVGEPDFDTPEHIRQAACLALAEGFTHYTATAGIAPLRKALARRYEGLYGAPWGEDEVAVGCGAKNVLFALAQALFGPGDDVAIFTPWWVSYPDQVRLAGARPVFIPTREEDGFTPRAADLAARLTPATRGVILNTPCNPTGAVIPASELRAFATLAREKDLAVISDEVYEAFTWDGEPHASMASCADLLGDRLVVVSAFSKTYAMTGWRVGYAIGAGDIIRGVLKVLSHDSSQAPSFAQKAALAALEGPQDGLVAMRAEYGRRRSFVLDAVRSIPGMTAVRPRGAFYLYPNVRGLYPAFGATTSTEIGNALIRNARVATVPGEAFGEEGYLRISYATSLENLREGMTRIREAARSGEGSRELPGR
jgi:aspartate aminotransferase